MALPPLNKEDKVIAGVCSGLAKHWGQDPDLVRFVFVICGLFWGLAVIAYLILAITMPKE